MASLRRDPSGNYVLRFRPSGRGSPFLYFNLGKVSAKDAKTKAAELEAKHRARKAGDATLTFSDLAKMYLEARGPELSAGSLSVYDRALGYLAPTFGTAKAADVAPLDVERYVLARRATGAAPNSVNTELRFLKAVLRWGESRRLLDRYPFRKGEAKLLKAPGRLIYMEPEEWQRFDETAERVDPRTAPVWRFLVLTGSRISEAVALRWKDVDRRFGKVVRIYQPKTQRTKAQTITADLEAVLKSLPAGEPNDPVFVTPAGGPWERVNLAQRFVRVARLAGLAEGVHGKLSVHTLRHTAATLLRRAGVPLDRIAEVLGHAELRSTLVYAHIRPDDVAATLDTLAGVLRERTVNETEAAKVKEATGTEGR